MLDKYFKRWRWWWIVAVLMAAIAAPVTFAVEHHWYEISSFWKYILGSLLIFMASVLGIWTFAVAPWLSANDHDPKWTTLPVYHLNTLRLAVWTPTVIFVICGMWLDGIPYLLKGINTGKWSFRFELWMNAVFPIFAICISYGWFMGKAIQSRFTETTKLRRICLKCGYNLKGISSKRCPECGGVSSPLSSSP